MAGAGGAAAAVAAVARRLSARSRAGAGAGGVVGRASFTCGSDGGTARGSDRLLLPRTIVRKVWAPGSSCGGGRRPNAGDGSGIAGGVTELAET